MKSILEELYCALEPVTTIKGNSTEIINKAEKRLCKNLKGGEKDLFYDYAQAYSEFNALTALESYKQGFKTGMRFADELQYVD